MTNMGIEMRPDGSIVVSSGSRVYVSPSDRPRRHWYEDGPRGAQRVSESRRRRLEHLRRNRTADLHIHRFPRLPLRFPRLPIRRFCRETAEDVARFRTAWLIAALEKRALNWIGRGLKANKKLGKIFLRLKGLVGHGHFREYYERTFGKCGIPFRTAQAYMLLARKTGQDANCADSALFPEATDPQAVEIREATEAHELAVAAARSDSSDEESSPAEHPSSHAEESGDSTCTCRPSLHVTEEQKDRISALWRSEHRASAESEVIDRLMELCDRYEGSSDSGAEEVDD